jgi:CRP-like cAMP-binding protein
MSRHKLTRSQLRYLLQANAERQEPPDTPYSSPFLHLFISADSGHLAHSFTERRFAPGEIIFHEGETGNTMYLIRSAMAIFKGDFDAPTMLVFRKAGELIGEMSLLDNQPLGHRGRPGQSRTC